jgi:hypothetical protein
MPTSTPAELAKRHLEKQAAKSKGKTVVEVELPSTKKDEDTHGRPQRAAKKGQVQRQNPKTRKAVEVIQETQDEGNGGLIDNQNLEGQNEAGTATNIEENADVNKQDGAPLHKDGEDEQESSENLVDDHGEEEGSIYEEEEDDEEESSDADDDAPPQKKKKQAV